MADYQQNFLNSLQGGFQFGQQLKQQRDQSALNQLASQAYSTAPEQRTGLLGQMAGISPQAAQAQQQAWDGDEQRRNKSMVNMAKLLTSAPEQARPGLWRSFVPTLSQYGLSELPQEYNDQTAPIITQAAQSLVSAYGDLDKQTPTGYLEFDMKARAAGLKPGSPEYEQAARVALGVEGRASNAGYNFDTIDIGDGKQRRLVNDPRTGLQMYYDERVGDYVRLGSGASGGRGPAPTPNPLPGAGGASAGTGDNRYRVEIEGISPERQQQIANVVSTMRAANFSDDQIAGWIEGALQSDFAQQSGGAPSQTGLTRAPIGVGAGRSKEDEAGAVTSAQEAAKLSYLPQELALKTEAAIQQAAGTQAAKDRAERVAAAPGAIQTLQTSLDSIDALLGSPNLGDIVGFGSLNPINRIPGTEARGLIARADQIAGQAFLAAFNQLKGGGAITEKEGAAATAAMARLDRSQSLADYKKALEDLKAAISPAIERQRQILSGGQGRQSGQSGGVDDLLSKYGIR